MKHLHQKLDTKDDSFTYTVVGANGPTYRVDNSGYLTKDGNRIGKFNLAGSQWHLVIDNKIFMSGPENGLHMLPEFELKALTALVNL